MMMYNLYFVSRKATRYPVRNNIGVRKPSTGIKLHEGNRVLMSMSNMESCINTLLLYIYIDECSSDPCMNGGSCTDGINSYNCDCVSGYSGEDCEIGMCCITDILVTLYVLGGNMFNWITNI